MENEYNGYADTAPAHKQQQQQGRQQQAQLGAGERVPHQQQPHAHAHAQLKKGRRLDPDPLPPTYDEAMQQARRQGSVSAPLSTARAPDADFLAMDTDAAHAAAGVPAAAPVPQAPKQPPRAPPPPAADTDLLGFSDGAPSPAAAAVPPPAATSHIDDMFSMPARQPPKPASAAAAAAAAPRPAPAVRPGSGSVAGMQSAKQQMQPSAFASMMDMGDALPAVDTSGFETLYGDGEVSPPPPPPARLAPHPCRPRDNSNAFFELAFPCLACWAHALMCTRPAMARTLPHMRVLHLSGLQEDGGGADDEPEMRRLLRQRRIQEKHERMQRQVCMRVCVGRHVHVGVGGWGGVGALVCMCMWVGGVGALVCMDVRPPVPHPYLAACFVALCY
jgi:hypothetical protein